MVRLRDHAGRAGGPLREPATRRVQVAAVLVVFALAGVASAFAATSSLLFLPPLWVNLGLAWLFGHTLAPGREALVTRFARQEHPVPTPRILAYTRRLTWVWTVFFLSMALVSGALAAIGAHEAWAWFTAVGNYLCVAALFMVEYGYRRWRFPVDSRVSPQAAAGDAARGVAGPPALINQRP